MQNKKGNYAKFLKTLHGEQVVKLQAKNQQECDLLEDIRSYTLKRSAIERSYSEALLKISSVYLNKKIPTIPDIKTDGGAEQWNMWNVWRTVLEENEKLAKARLAAVEVFSQSVVDSSKHLRVQKAAAAKKCVETLQTVQKELQLTVQEVDKTKKLYFDEEHCAHDVRDKAKDIEEKLKKKKGSFFQSITSLQKNSAKVSSKRDQLEEKSTGARNDYLLSLAAANAHQRRYFLVDLQQAMQIMENDVYERVADYLMLISRTELLTCSATQASFSRIRDQAQQLTREYNLQCVYLYYPVLKQHIQYDFEPCDNDPVDKITAEHSSAVVTLSKEAKRWATKIGRENNCIKENNRKLQTLLALRDSGQKVDPNDPNGPDVETKIDELRQIVRKAETSKMKAEARIECLRHGGVNVDEFLQDVETLSVQEMPRSSSSMSVRTDASEMGEPAGSDSYYDSDNFEGTPEKKVDKTDSDDEERRRHDSEVDAMLEQERQRIEQLTAGWDDPTQVEWGTDDHTETVPSVAVSAPVGDSQAPNVYKCVALYSYTAQNPDELSMVESEQLEVVGEGDGDGWLKARNYRGEEGFVPQNYLDVDRSLTVSQGGSSYQLNTQISFSSVDYTVDEENIPGIQEAPCEAVVDTSTAWSAPPGEAGNWPASTEQQAPWPDAGETGTAVDGGQWVTDFKAQSGPDSTTSIEQEFAVLEEGFHYCIALYDYEATAPEELSFVENQVIKLLKKLPHDVDDGWWEGELNGKIGLFPSLVVEECRADGQPLTPEAPESPPESAPPVFTPPEVPTFLVAPEHVIITQPTPIGDSSEGPKEEISNGKEIKPATTEGFQLNMSKGQHELYKKHYNEVDVKDGEEPTQEVTDSSKPVTVQKGKIPSFGGGLGVAEIVITAATPMMEEPETPFPPVPEEGDDQAKDQNEKEGPAEAEQEKDEKAIKTRESSEEKISEPEEQTEEEGSTSDAVTTILTTATNAQTDDNDEQTDDCPTDSAAFPVSSSTGSEEEPSTGPSTAENSQSNTSPPAAVVPAAALSNPNIPEELDPHQLAKLKSLKESNA
ncbi:hypothetical protein RUM43_002617 [Polyplax serrata]|uniref:F-BAR and double SH3 domains protein 2 n=1 Tax=Polyplax serrata TaxID=468196 RepID=A0AAN8NZE4_POLSC